MTTRAELRRNLAAAIGNLVWKDEQIRDFVQRLATVQVKDVEWFSASGLTWEHLLARLENNADYAGIGAVIALGKSEAGARNWEQFNALTAPAPGETAEAAIEPAETTWSRLDVDARWVVADDSKDDPRTMAVISDQREVVQASVTLRWEGKRPDEPTMTIAPNRDDNGNVVTWIPSQTTPTFVTYRASLPVMPNAIATKRIFVSATSADKREMRSVRRYLVARKGLYLAAAIWLAFWAFAVFRLSKIAPGWLAILLAPLGLGTSVVVSFVLDLLKSEGLDQWFKNALKIWERGAVVAISASAAVALVPILLCVQLTNRTQRKVEMMGGVADLEATASGLAAWGVGLAPAVKDAGKFCLGASCGPDCVAEGAFGVKQVVVCCKRPNCEDPCDTVVSGTDTYQICPQGPKHPVKFPANTIASGLAVSGGTGEQLRINHDPTDKWNSAEVTLRFRDLGRDQTYKVAFDHEGSIERCAADSTDIAVLTMDTTPTTATFVTRPAGGVASTSTWKIDKDSAAIRPPVRACTRPADQLEIDIPVDALPNETVRIEAPATHLVLNSAPLRCNAMHVVALSYNGPRQPFADAACPVVVLTAAKGLACDPPIKLKQDLTLDKEKCTYEPGRLSCEHEATLPARPRTQCYVAAGSAMVTKIACTCDHDLKVDPRLKERRETLLAQPDALGCTEVCVCR